MSRTSYEDRQVASRRLIKMYKEYEANPSPYFNCGFVNNDPFHWRVIINGVEGTDFAGGYFPAELTFPNDYPFNPPKMHFKCPMWHPNIDKDTGEVCISILHKPGVDLFNEQESPGERWNPIHTVESIIISVLSMLQSPNPESPLNIPANREFMNDPEAYKDHVRQCTRKSVDYL